MSICFLIEPRWRACLDRIEACAAEWSIDLDAPDRSGEPDYGPQLRWARRQASYANSALTPAGGQRYIREAEMGLERAIAMHASWPERKAGIEREAQDLRRTPQAAHPHVRENLDKTYYCLDLDDLGSARFFLGGAQLIARHLDEGTWP